jgi:probable rRNA maturation factor
VTAPSDPRSHIAVRYRTRRPWAPAAVSLRRWARAAGAPDDAELCIAVVGRAESRRLNRHYRGKDKPTNVLSFPAPGPVPDGAALLGDLVVCAPVVAAEARLQRKRIADHWAHLVVHGCLHLQGYDHERDADAQRMERREVRILAALGVADPYEDRS